LAAKEKVRHKKKNDDDDDEVSNESKEDMSIEDLK
jgi:hypothetical protein